MIELMKIYCDVSFYIGEFNAWRLLVLEIQTLGAVTIVEGSCHVILPNDWNVSEALI